MTSGKEKWKIVANYLKEAGENCDVTHVENGESLGYKIEDCGGVKDGYLINYNNTKHKKKKHEVFILNAYQDVIPSAPFLVVYIDGKMDLFYANSFGSYFFKLFKPKSSFFSYITKLKVRC